jgi:CspA family cold shock protein
LIGRVKFYDAKKGFGFIKAENSEVFVHAKELRESGITDDLVVDQEVTFDTKEGAKGPRACNVRRV